MKESVVLVNEQDQMYGTMDKLAAHLCGNLHRALSVFIFNSSGQLLVQQRALGKYHSEGLWSNTCCSHPKPGEKTNDAANRRLMEEMGLQAQLFFAFHFIYRAEFENGLIENEFDHVFFGISDECPVPNPKEVSAYKYMSLTDLGEELILHPDKYSKWLNICYQQIVDYYGKWLVAA